MLRLKLANKPGVQINGFGVVAGTESVGGPIMQGFTA